MVLFARLVSRDSNESGTILQPGSRIASADLLRTTNGNMVGCRWRPPTLGQDAFYSQGQSPHAFQYFAIHVLPVGPQLQVTLGCKPSQGCNFHNFDAAEFTIDIDYCFLFSI